MAVSSHLVNSQKEKIANFIHDVILRDNQMVLTTLIAVGVGVAVYLRQRGVLLNVNQQRRIFTMSDELPKCNDLHSLQDCVKKVLEQLRKVAADVTQNMEQAQKEVTSYIVEVINDLHTHMQQQKYDNLFLITLLYPLSYDTIERTFGHTLSLDDLEYFSKVLEDHITEFNEVQFEGVVQKQQAYLFYLAVSLLPSRVDSEFQSMCCHHLLHMQKEIQLDPDVKDILSKCSVSSGYDWAALQQEMLVMYTSADDAQRTVGSQLLKFLTAVQSATKHKSKLYKPQSPRAEISKEVQNVFEVMGVSDYYPQKLTRKHALCIREQTLESKQFYILEKIMMQNYQYWECLSQNGTFSLHPVDSLLALLLCADNFLRQDLLVKLSTCKLAIPLLLPDPSAQTVTLPLWGMRSIVKEWKCKDTSTGVTTSMECSMVEHETPIVSFMRFSDSDPDSVKTKSKVLNEVIGNSQHNFFFHWDCEGGTEKRVLVNGVVELCWYLPAGNEADSCNEAIAFTNLRGDARKYRMQVEFLRQVSFLNFVLLTQNDLGKESIEVLEQLSQSPGIMVLMFSDAKEEDELKYLETLSTKGLRYKTIKMMRKNLAVIKREIQSHITRTLHVQRKVDSDLPQFKSLKQCSGIAEKVGILIDENNPECIAGRRLAENVLQKVQEVKVDTCVNDKMLPLQSQAMWYTWAQHNKERHRHHNKGYKTAPAYNIQMDKKKDEIRGKQFSLCDPPTPVMKSFISSLIQQKGYIRDYFLHWLKFLLDKQCQHVLPPLQSQYNKLKCELQKPCPDETTGSEIHAEKEKYAKRRKQIRDELAEINDRMILASLGIEHLFRELGQIYESVIDVQMGCQGQKQVLKSLRSNISCLPEVAAELLLAGYPFELMDGDASHVPMTWMTAVLNELHILLKHTGDAKVFIVSVLGIQSSGKSTLMNTMFGAKFAVSAGRCTRGAFIQLIPIQKDTEPCDYLLVVDTEGLRAPELDPQKMLKHDNEMATFVIALANITIINILGETPSDMQDILQTSVHAFLRMKKLELKPSCQFVHQNVTAIAAGSKLIQGRAKLVENLNEMVKYAAKEEQCESKYTSFDQVLSFDIENDVWYFPSLWRGDPPMAPVNPGYSNLAQNLKSALTATVTAKSKLSIIKFRKHIEQLWNAILYENFIFSFKNMVEMAAYNELDSKRGQWSCKLQSDILNLQAELENIVFSSDVTELDHLEQMLIDQSDRDVQNLQEKLLKQAEEFFESCDEITIQWKEHTQRNLIHLCMKHRDQTDDHCRSLIRHRRDRVALDRLRTNIYQKIQEPVRTLASELQGRELGKEELEKQFTGLWEKLRTQELTAKPPEIDMTVESSVECSLKDLFHSSKENTLIQKLSKCGLRKRGERPLEMPVKPKKHFSTTGWWTNVTYLFGGHHEVVAQKTTNKFLKDAKEHLRKQCSTMKDYTEPLGYHVLRKVSDAVDKYNQTNGEFIFTEEYKIDLCLRVAGYAVKQFEKTIQENAPLTIFEKLREPFYITFESQCSQRSIETAAAISLSSHLKRPIQNGVIDSLGPEVVCMVRRHDERFCNQQSLLYNILLDLEKKKNFAEFILYLRNVKESLRTWIKKYTLEYCHTSTEGGQLRFEQLAAAKLSLKVALIKDAAMAATQSHPETLRHWLTKFHEPLKGSFHLNLEEIFQVLGVAETGSNEDSKQDFKHFEQELVKHLQSVEEEVHSTLKSLPEQMKTWKYRPYEILVDEMFGCCEQCPFCGMKCEYMDPKHPGDHRVSIHRPQCLGGYRWVSNQEFLVDVCTSLVESDTTFRNKDTNDKPHPYKKYREIYENWTIIPNSSRYDSSFWKYFVAHYTDELAEHFKMKKPHPGSDGDKVLQEWKKLDREKVLETLRESFML